MCSTAGGVGWNKRESFLSCSKLGEGSAGNDVRFVSPSNNSLARTRGVQSAEFIQQRARRPAQPLGAIVLALRYGAAAVLGLGVAVCIWAVLFELDYMFREMSLSGLVPGVFGGVLGGLTAAAVVPRHKVPFAMGIGVLVCISISGLLLFRGIWFKTDVHLLWSSPLWVLPAFAAGAYLARYLRGRISYSVLGAFIAGGGALMLYQFSQPASFCEAVEGGASLEELTEFLREHDPSRLSQDGSYAQFEHTTSRPFSCLYEISDGNVVSTVT